MVKLSAYWYWRMDKILHQLETIGNYEARKIMGLQWGKPSRVYQDIFWDVINFHQLKTEMFHRFDRLHIENKEW